MGTLTDATPLSAPTSKLYQGRRSFAEFWAEFQRLAAELDYNQTSMIDDLRFKRLPYSPVPTILQRLPFSSDCHSPATAILQRLLFSSAYHSPDYFNAFQQIFCQAATGANFSTRLQQWPTDEL